MYFGITVPQHLEVEADNPVGARPGEWVEVALPSRQLLRAVVLVYGSLFLAFWLGVLLGWMVARLAHIPQAPLLGIGGALGLTIGVRWLRWLDRNYRPSYRVATVFRRADGAGSAFTMARCERCG